MLSVGVVVSCLVLETVMRLMGNFSYNVKVLSTNPYQQQYLARITNLTDLMNMSCCPQLPGSNINGFIINSHGFETPEVPYQKPPNTQRLVLLGDSQAVGVVPYPETFSRLMEKTVSTTTNKKFQVINLGMNGIGPLMEEKTLEIEGQLYHPDIVLLSFFVGNDFTDDIIYSKKYQLEKKHIIPLWMYQSKLFLFIRNSIRSRMMSTTLPSLRGDVSKTYGVYTGQTYENDQSPNFSEAEYLYLESKRADLLVKNSSQYINLNAVKESVLQMKSISDQIGATFIVLIIPEEFQMNPILLSQIMNMDTQKPSKTLVQKMTDYIYFSDANTKNWSATTYDIQLPQKILEDFFHLHGIQFIDPLPEWMKEASGSSYYRLRDSHLNVQGNQSVSDIISPILVNELTKEATK